MRFLNPIRPANFIRSASQRRCVSDLRSFAAGDLVLLRQKADRTANPILTRPLQSGKRIEGHRGVILHDDIIGKRVRDVVRSQHSKSLKDGTEYRLFSVTLDDYVRLSRRLVTPIYPADANLIVSLLDLHEDAGDAECDDRPKLEILEAGTGHGALTLYLSRAIHGANAHCKSTGEGAEDETWRARRRAVIHTTDVSPKFSEHARNNVHGFRHGMYARNVDFHVGDVSVILQELRKSRGVAPFLSHAFLDLPAANRHLAAVADALRTDGTLIVFNPSITQITACVTHVKDDQIPLDLETVIELGVNGGSGGREWDVRFVHPRRSDDNQAVEAAKEDAEADDLDENSSSAGLRTPLASYDRKWSLVCRPKVGERITGGGFLGVWKKQRNTKA